MSRSGGRIRKKSSKFADFESPDDIDGLYKKKGSPTKGPHKLQPPKIMDSDSDSSDSDDTESDIDMREDTMSFSEDWGDNVDPGEILDNFKDDDLDNEDSLQVDEDPSSISKEDSNYSRAHRYSTVGADWETGKRKKQKVQRKANSLYFSEKKKASSKDNTTERKRKTERKDKGKARFTAYMLWARANRQKITEENPLMDFTAVNKRLGEMWALVPYTSKHNWKRKAKKLEAREDKTKQGKTMISTGKGPSASNSAKSNLLNKGKLQTLYSNNSPTTRVGHKGQSKAQALSQTTSTSSQKHSYQTPKSNKGTTVSVLSDMSPPASFKVTGTSPIDVAAHLKLLGESLNNVGQKLKEHEGQIAVSGSLSVLLDSMLCVLGPLACLSNQLEETRGAIHERTLANILDNIAYIMPGIF